MGHLRNARGDTLHIYSSIKSYVNLLYSSSNEHDLQGFSFLIGNDWCFFEIWRSNSWSCVRFHFLMKASFKVDTEGWYCVRRANLFPLCCCVSGVQTLSLLTLFPIEGFLPKGVGSLIESSVFLNLKYFPQM